MSSADFTITNKSKTVQFDVHSRRGLKGDTGATGDSAYQAWLDLGNTGDEAAFVASLKGVQGDQGIQGIQGEKGDKGDTGDTGATGAKGDKGDTGAQGVQGIQGEQGLQGIQGIPGAQGVKGDTGAQGDPGVVQSVNGQSVANVVLDHTDVGADQAGAAAAAQMAAELHADIAVSNLNQSLGSAAFSDDSDFATAAQGALADTAVQIESDPTVPSWAKVDTQPFETGAEVNTVTSVNTRTGAVTGLAEASDLTAHTGNTSNPHGVTKAQVGLGNVDNTSDANKPVSAAQAAADALKVNKAGDTMTGTLSLPTIVMNNAVSGISSSGASTNVKISGGAIDDGGTVVLFGSSVGNTGNLRIGSTNIAYWSSMRFSPSADNAYALGNTSQQWSNIYSTQATIGGVLYVTGTGFPEGVVTAPVGSIYIDKVITNGASSWIKKSGTGSTGWQVLEGDTGWRNITSLASTEIAVVNSNDYGYYIRRVNNQVQINIKAQTATASWNGQAISVPDGFRVINASTPVAMGEALQTAGPGRGQIQIGPSLILVSSTWSTSGIRFTYNLVTTTTNAWPATLPGTAV